MSMDKKKVAMTALKVTSGYSAIARTVSGIKESAGRLGSLTSLFRKPPVIRNGAHYVVYTPFLFQYGRIENGIFMPDGVAENKDDIPSGDGITYFKGAYFAGNDFGEMIGSLFTPAQIEEMIDGAGLRKSLLAMGAATIIVIAFLFAAFGKPVGLASLPAAGLLLTFAIRNGIYAERLQRRQMIGLADYFKTYGPVMWVLA